MERLKRYRMSQIDRMSDAEREEYYQAAVEHYGNLKNQLKGFKAKGILHPLLRLITHAFPVKVIKLNDYQWTTDSAPVIFSANHTNANDFPALGQSIKKHCFILADYTMINDPVVSLANRINGCVYIDRKSKKSAANAFAQCVDGVECGYSMIIFPESTWNLTKSMPILPRYWGDVRIAQETGSPIVPVIMVYCGKICLMKFGKRIYVSKEDSVAEKDREVYNAMVALRKEIEESPECKKYHIPTDYTEWVKRNIVSYKYFDVEYELSCIRKDAMLPEDELKQIALIGEEIRPPVSIRKELKYAKINYRYED